MNKPDRKAEILQMIHDKPGMSGADIWMTFATRWHKSHPWFKEGTFLGDLICAFCQPSSGTIYPALSALEAEYLIYSEWAPLRLGAKHRVRRYYPLSSVEIAAYQAMAIPSEQVSDWRRGDTLDDGVRWNG